MSNHGNGEKVFHPTLGKGVILEGNNGTYTVKYESGEIHKSKGEELLKNVLNG
jgi:hypothetical protein